MAAMALDLEAIKAMLMDPRGLRPQQARAALEETVARVEELEAERDAARLARDLFQRQETDAIRYWQQARADLRDRDRILSHVMDWAVEADSDMYLAGYKHGSRTRDELEAERDALKGELERLRALCKEITHDAQTLSQNNLELRKENERLKAALEATLRQWLGLRYTHDHLVPESVTKPIEVALWGEE